MSARSPLSPSCLFGWHKGLTGEGLGSNVACESNKPFETVVYTGLPRLRVFLAHCMPRGLLLYCACPIMCTIDPCNNAKCKAMPDYSCESICSDI